ncbi:hypothetical protein FN846DRAFT_936291 [Sphaerosporella brunnea]|uniref:Uncharacterized protein n=1 Tax=Sphaerosporella brunnea TaxID=1250544 RepID=A0A5J5F4P9_9PEZI|nr:hypothetical protein FN846DRAFT_936291 [Sphaerosporella brunnea]
MPLNIIQTSDEESDIASASDYEIVHPPSRPASWETYHDPYDSEGEYVAPPRARSQRRRSSVSSEERKLRKLKREEQELKEQLRLVRQADEKEAVFRGGPAAAPSRVPYQNPRGGFEEVPAHAPPPSGPPPPPLGYHGGHHSSGGVPESRSVHHSAAGRRSPHVPVYAAAPGPVYELDSDGPARRSGRHSSISPPARRRNSTSPPTARVAYSRPPDAAQPSRHTQYINPHEGRPPAPPAAPVDPYAHRPPPSQGPAPGAPRARMSGPPRPSPDHSAPPTRSGSYYREADGEGVPAYSPREDREYRATGSRPRVPPSDEAPGGGYRYVHAPPQPRPYDASSDGLYRVSPSVYGHPDPLRSRPPPPPGRVSGGSSGEVPVYRAPAPLPTPLKLRDPTGHVFSFPYTQCKKWNVSYLPSSPKNIK